MAKYISISLLIFIGCFILLLALLPVFEDVMISFSCIFLLLLSIIISFLVRIVELLKKNYNLQKATFNKLEL
ncbi:hypothetical protein JFV29_08940 [Peribacillus sp. TH16]|jgi:hypothetical protein|uniref:hypothetical protein n=1 Tax=unclassified Peribacillus TaxID=2675266 RepID=UPI0019135E1D|nr:MULTISPECIES: hypothetical protein [unclassified Peribacillus]MBK5445041.1 hypothetical protein [Peribacillus sp. TH24]MBK5482049.1 hypothetical protein [Peribacillus sp. TH16]